VDHGDAAAEASTGSAEQVAAWLRRENTEYGQGRYTLSDAKLVFDLTSPHGSVSHVGTIGRDSMWDDALTLDVHSMINGERGTRDYSFAQVDFP
jgi:hypothetical protein